MAGTVVVTIITGALVLLPIAGIARLLGGDRAGLAAAWIAAFALGLITVPANQGGGSENPFMFLVLSAVWAALGVAGRRDKWLYVGTAASGLCIGLAYLTRPEGIGYAAIVFPVLIAGALGGLAAIRRRRPDPGSLRRAAAITLCFGLAVGVCVVPYVDYLHTNTGRWELTAKTRDASLDAWRAVAEGDRRKRDEIFYELGPGDSTDFVADRFTLSHLIKDDPGGYAGIIGVNVREAASELFGVDLEPYPVWQLIPAAGHAARALGGVATTTIGAPVGRGRPRVHGDGRPAHVLRPAPVPDPDLGRALHPGRRRHGPRADPMAMVGGRRGRPQPPHLALRRLRRAGSLPAHPRAGRAPHRRASGWTSTPPRTAA